MIVIYFNIQSLDASGFASADKCQKKYLLTVAYLLHLKSQKIFVTVTLTQLKLEVKTLEGGGEQLQTPGIKLNKPYTLLFCCCLDQTKIH